jgi:uncharacterized protein YndB with AHSA1/START domain
MVDVVTSTIINRPRKEVAEYAADPDNAPKWYENIKSSVLKTSHPLSVGTRMDFEAHFLGRKLIYTYEIREYTPGRRLIMETQSGPFHMQTSYEWEDAPNNATKMTLRNRGCPSGFSKLLAPFITVAMKQANKKDLRLLKSILESN